MAPRHTGAGQPGPRGVREGFENEVDWGRSPVTGGSLPLIDPAVGIRLAPLSDEIDSRAWNRFGGLYWYVWTKYGLRNVVTSGWQMTALKARVRPALFRYLYTVVGPGQGGRR